MTGCHQRAQVSRKGPMMHRPSCRRRAKRTRPVHKVDKRQSRALTDLDRSSAALPHHPTQMERNGANRANAVWCKCNQKKGQPRHTPPPTSRHRGALNLFYRTLMPPARCLPFSLSLFRPISSSAVFQLFRTFPFRSVLPTPAQARCPSNSTARFINTVPAGEYPWPMILPTYLWVHPGTPPRTPHCPWQRVAAQGDEVPCSPCRSCRAPPESDLRNEQNSKLLPFPDRFRPLLPPCQQLIIKSCSILLGLPFGLFAFSVSEPVS